MGADGGRLHRVRPLLRSIICASLNRAQESLMKYQLFSYEGTGGEAHPGIAVDGGFFDLRKAVGNDAHRWPVLDDLLADWAAASERLRSLASSISNDRTAFAGFALHQLSFLPPLTRCGVIYAAGANYRDHVEAMARAMNMKLVT